MWKVDSLERTLILRGIGGRRRRGQQRMRWLDGPSPWLDHVHHPLDGHEFEWTRGVGDGQGGLSCCDSWGHKELDTTEWLNWTELMAQMVKNLTVKQETWVWSLGREDSLEKQMETLSSGLAWKIPWTEEPGGLQSQRVGHDWATNTWLL